MESVRRFLGRLGAFEHRHEFLAALLLLTIVGYGVFSNQFHQTQSAHAAGGTNYAWSENIGWASFSSSNSNSSNVTVCSSPQSATSYGVCEGSGGNLSGYAWSENIGWISFNAADVSGCPSGICTPQVQSTTDSQGNHPVTGWARACGSFDSKASCSGTQNSAGGWQGWIHLSGSNYGFAQIAGTCGLSSYSYAWGGGNAANGSDADIGWVHGAGSGYQVVFADNGSGCSSLPVTASLSANPTITPAVPGNQTVLTWSSTNASTCSPISNDANGTTISTSGATSGSIASVTVPNSPTTYSITCSNANSSKLATVSVTVQGCSGICGGGGLSITLTAAPSSGWADAPPANNNIKYSGGSNDAALTLATSAGVHQCDAVYGGSNASNGIIVALNGGANDTVTDVGSTVVVPFNYYVACYDNSGAFIPPAVGSCVFPTTYSWSSNAINSTNKGNCSAQASVNVSGQTSTACTINPFNASPGQVQPGEASSLSWGTTNCDTCSLTLPNQSPSPVGVSINSPYPPGYSTGAISQTTTFTLSCQNTTNSTSAQLQTAVNVQSIIEI